MNSCKKEIYHPVDCDLIFQIAENNDFSKAITDATARQDEVKFDHVGMIFIENGLPYVVEASSKKGVSSVPLEQFIRRLPAGYIIKRTTCDFSPTLVIQHAKSHLGEPYDWSFLPNNGKMYCSELIYECFIDVNGQHIFHTQPMNFRNEQGELPQFWIDLFEKLGENVPEGIEGTNPNDLSKENTLIEVWREIK